MAAACTVSTFAWVWLCERSSGPMTKATALMMRPSTATTDSSSAIVVPRCRLFRDKALYRDRTGCIAHSPRNADRAQVAVHVQVGAGTRELNRGAAVRGHREVAVILCGLILIDKRLAGIDGNVRRARCRDSMQLGIAFIIEEPLADGNRLHLQRIRLYVGECEWHDGEHGE